jgi:valyl-tRNA synthetase
VLRHVLDALMRLLHPFIPFITEEIASKMPLNGTTVMVGPYPEADPSKNDEEAEASMTVLMGVISAVRTIRSEMNLAPSRSLPVVVFPSSAQERDLMQANLGMILSLGRMSALHFENPGEAVEPPRMSATAVVGETRIFVPLEGIVDPDAEIARLEKDLAKIRKEFDAVEKKLANEGFLAKANPEAVQKQRDRHAELAAKLAGLGEGLNKMRSLKG